MENEPNPHLKDAGREISEILDKYDIPGICFLFHEMQIETVVKLDASFSVISIDENRHLKVKHPLEDPVRPARAKKMITTTVNMLANLRMRLFNMMQILGQAEMNVRQRFGLDKPKETNGIKN